MAYTVQDIEALRRAIFRRAINMGEISRVEEMSDTVAEIRVQTYVQAGITAADLAQADKDELDRQVAAYGAANLAHEANISSPMMDMLRKQAGL